MTEPYVHVLVACIELFSEKLSDNFSDKYKQHTNTHRHFFHHLEKFSYLQKSKDDKKSNILYLFLTIKH